MGHKGKGLHMVTFLLLVIGGLNWLVLALFNWEIGSLFGGMDAMVSKVIYVLVGLSALYELFTHKKCCSVCSAKANSSAAPGGGQPQS
jgi:uncharacterized protein